MKLIAGRDFTERDTPQTEPVIIINETFARLLWPGQDPLGKRMQADRPVRRVVGVVADVRHLALEKAAGNEMYLPMRQSQDRMSADLVVRSSLPVSDLAARVREALTPVEPNLPVREFRQIQSLVDRSVSPRRFLVLILTGFAAFSLLLASLGIYALISYSVSQRTQELGIRMALGASPATLQSSVLFETLRLAAIGIVVGIAGALAAARWLGSMLFGVTSSDPLSFVASFAVLLAAAALAGYLPARSILQIDAKTTLRAG
jgi:ABC-type lipoprotein release transport system permease subunit